MALRPRVWGWGACQGVGFCTGSSSAPKAQVVCMNKPISVTLAIGLFFLLSCSYTIDPKGSTEVGALPNG